MIALKLYTWTPNSPYMSGGAYILLASSLEEAKSMFLEKLKQIFQDDNLQRDPERNETNPLDEWQVKEQELSRGFIFELGPSTIA